MHFLKHLNSTQRHYTLFIPDIYFERGPSSKPQSSPCIPSDPHSADDLAYTKEGPGTTQPVHGGGGSRDMVHTADDLDFGIVGGPKNTEACINMPSISDFHTADGERILSFATADALKVIEIVDITIKCITP